MYARGMTVRELQSHMEEIYGVDVSHEMISNITDSILDEITQWQNRPLDTVYPIVFLDAIVVKSRDNGRVVNKSVYLALGVNMNGHKEILGFCIG
jgi:putative transposase